MISNFLNTQQTKKIQFNTYKKKIYDNKIHQKIEKNNVGIKTDNIEIKKDSPKIKIHNTEIRINNQTNNAELEKLKHDYKIQLDKLEEKKYFENQEKLLQTYNQNHKIALEIQLKQHRQMETAILEKSEQELQKERQEKKIQLEQIYSLEKENQDKQTKLYTLEKQSQDKQIQLDNLEKQLKQEKQDKQLQLEKLEKQLKQEKQDKQIQLEKLEKQLKQEKQQQQDKQIQLDNLDKELKEEKQQYKIILESLTTLKTQFKNKNMTNEIQLAKIKMMESNMRQYNVYNIPTINLVYQYSYKNNKNVTGFGDFIRGCFYMLQFADNYNLHVSFNIFNHPIKNFLDYFSVKEDISEEISNDIVFFDTINHTYETKNNMVFYKYNDIDDILLKFIKNSKTYNKNKYLYLVNHPDENNISESHKEQIRQIIKPNIRLSAIIETAISNLHLIKYKFRVIHLRMKDECFYGNIDSINKKMANHIINYISTVKEKTDDTLVLISSNKLIKSVILKSYPDIKCIFQEITHIADSSITNDNNLINTLKEFYIMSYSNYIYSFSVYQHGSGFSKWCAVAYDIPYVCMLLQE